jgi:hypothetical protein
VVLSTSKNSSRGFCAFLATDVDAAAAEEEKSRLPSALDRDSITAVLKHNGSEKGVRGGEDSRTERGRGGPRNRAT